ncbi:MAG TPA: ParB/RepB/Spo0J family partition protein [Actinoplanes sp.]|nr:ParB/RepB/Spo0J family partition protein [Actinoplanes sp.]
MTGAHRHTTDLLPLEEVTSRIGELNRSYAGVRSIPVDAIIGSLDRSRDFDRSFTPRQPHLRQRLRSVGGAFPDGDFPPIQAVEVGGAYFVIDGHHRVALARRLGMEFIEAEITSVSTRYAVPSGVDIATLVHTDAHRRFHRDSALSTLPQPPVIEFSRPQGYPELLEVIRAWGYERSLEAGSLLPPEEVAARWVEEVYLPGCAALHKVELPAAYRYKTKADLFLWVHQLLRAMLVSQREASYCDAAGQARRQRVSRRVRRRFLRTRTRPLPQRN